MKHVFMIFPMQIANNIRIFARAQTVMESQQRGQSYIRHCSLKDA